MLPNSMWQLLLSHNIHVIALGDPFQLPVINPLEDNHILEFPHIFLDEIMRQALDSEIIRFSMWIREGKSIASYPTENKEVMIVHQNELNAGMLTWADQVICATNDTRTQLNNQIRKIYNFPIEPQIGDKIISLTNHWDFDDPPLTNGSIGIIKDSYVEYLHLPWFIREEPIKVLYTTMVDETGHVFYDIPIDYNCLLTGKKTLTPKQEAQIRNNKRLKEEGIEAPYDFAYANSITVHKAQGSQWDKVLTYEENFPFKKDEHARWIYTAATRPSSRLVFVRK